MAVPRGITKKHLRELLERQSIDEIVDLAGRKRRLLGMLVSLTFDRDPLIAWRAIEAMGAAAERIAEDDPNCVRDHLRRLHWLLSEESGGICWHAPEAMAEILRRRPELLSDYVPIVVSLIREMAEEDLAHFRPGILWAIGRLGPIARTSLDTVLPAIEACLSHPNPQVRGMAVWCLGEVGQARLLSRDRRITSGFRAEVGYTGWWCYSIFLTPHSRQWSRDPLSFGRGRPHEVVL